MNKVLMGIAAATLSAAGYSANFGADSVGAAPAAGPAA
jgi:hypothetical protein